MSKILQSDAWEVGTAPRRPSQLLSRDQLSPLQKRTDVPGLIFLIAHLGLLGITGVLIFVAQDTFWLLCALFVHGVVLVHLFAPFHEATHQTAFASARLNTWVAWGTGLLIMIPPLYFKLEHAAHHTYTQHPERDPESIPQATTFGGYWYYASAIPYFQGVLKNLARHPLGIFSPQEQSFLPERLRASVQREAQLLLAIYAALLVISLLTESAVLFWYWLLPRLMGEPWMRLIRISEHGGCPWVADLLRNTRTTRTWAPVRWLAWNMPFHAEHHSFPNIPFHALPALHQYLRPHLEHVDEGYLASHRQLLRRLYQQDHAPLF